MKNNVRQHAPLDDRDIEAIRALGPRHPRVHSLRWRLDHRLHPRVSRKGSLGCGYCKRRDTTSRIVVNPITLRRTHEPLCGRAKCEAALRTWEGAADSRRRRAQMDWDRESPTVAALDLIGYIPPQYPSVSRATLRAFLDGDDPIATVKRNGSGEVTAAGLNSSIKSLGFAERVYAEIRSGEVVLRRVEVSA